MHFQKTLAASAVIIGTVYGHAMMNTPTPYGHHTVQTSPLNGQNFQFPCQSGGRPDAFDDTGINNQVTAGSTTLVKFTGSAIHGGGSCQFSVTYDFPPPSDPSKWKVIYSLIGGCPASAVGNVASGGPDGDGRPDGPQCGNDSGTECVRQFNIPIPKQLKNGKATFAWTWFNKIGNREIYMNCAPITITGGSGDSSYYDALPAMFVANYPGYCTTHEGVMDFPNPGANFRVLETPTPGANGNCPAGGSGGNGGSPAPAPPAVFAPGASQPTTVQTIKSKPTPPSTPPTANNPSNNSPPAQPPSAPVPPSGAAGVSCSPDGSVVCMGTDFWGLCDHGFAVKMAVAAGTKCQNGAISRRSVPRHHLHARIHGHS